VKPTLRPLLALLPPSRRRRNRVPARYAGVTVGPVAMTEGLTATSFFVRRPHLRRLGASEVQQLR
jgi:hypothetical protein